MHSNLYDYVADRPPQLGDLDVKEQTYRAEFRHPEFETERPVVEPIGAPSYRERRPALASKPPAEPASSRAAAALFCQRAVGPSSFCERRSREGSLPRASKPPAEPASSRAAAALFSRRAIGASPFGEQRSPGRQRA